MTLARPSSLSKAKTRRAAGSRRSAIRPRSPPRSPSISPSRPILPLFVDDIAGALRRTGFAAEFVALDDLPQRLRELAPQRDRTIVWALTDGVRFYRGSSVPALARLEGFARFGSPRHCGASLPGQVREPRARFGGRRPRPADKADGRRQRKSPRSANGRALSGPLFVKPNTLGAKIGIFADSLCERSAEAQDRSRRIWERYRDRALIQPFVEGDDVRVSFMDLGGEFADQLGVERIVKDAASETGGVFLTMKDNETLSGARDTAGGRGGFGAARPAAFVPRMVDLRARTTSGRGGRSRGSSIAAPASPGSSACATASRSISASTPTAGRPFSNSRSARP